MMRKIQVIQNIMFNHGRSHQKTRYMDEKVSKAEIIQRKRPDNPVRNPFEISFSAQKIERTANLNETRPK